MVVPAIEVVITRIGKHTIDDESTEDGKKWLEAFRAGAEQIPGVIRACWGVSYKDPEIAMHFIDYGTRLHHDTHKAQLGGPLPPILSTIMSPASTDLYVIHPTTPHRHVLYAPQTNVVFFYGIDEQAFATLAPEFFTAIAQSDACLGYIWGAIEPPVLADASGNAALGKGGIMISGWRSREEHDRDVAKERVVEAYKAVSGTVRKTETWGMQVAVVENNGHFHKWRRLTATDRTRKLVAPGNHP